MTRTDTDRLEELLELLLDGPDLKSAREGVDALREAVQAVEAAAEHVRDASDFILSALSKGAARKDIQRIREERRIEQAHEPKP